MALSYGFFDAELTPSGQYDRAYAAEQFAEYFHLIVSNGVFPDPATQLQVVASDTPNMNVNVSDGYGWINGYYAKNSGPYPLAIQAASGTLNRIDAVVLRWVNASRSMELAVKTGIAASSPATPALQRDTDVYELMLATVTVAAGATSIPQSSITDKRSDTSVCGLVTGAVQNIDTTNLFAQYDTAFHEWFDNIKSQLSGDVATNLQNQIDKNAADIATTLKADTKTALGLPASAGPDDAFKVLANVGNLHVWERVQTYAELVPTTDYLTSTDRNAYTEGTVDSTTITYLGQLGGGARIEVGSYVGTGTYGSSNPNSLTFGFEPKFLFISYIGMASLAVGLLSESYVTVYHIYYKEGLMRGDLNIKKNGNSIIWYSSSGSPTATFSPYNQMNVKGVTYNYIAIG